MPNYYKLSNNGSITLIPEDWIILNTDKVLKVNYPPFNDQKTYRKNSTALYENLNDAKDLSELIIQRRIEKLKRELKFLNKALSNLKNVNDDSLLIDKNKTFFVDF